MIHNSYFLFYIYKVLGHVAKYDISRPRELLAVDGLKDVEFDLDGIYIAKYLHRYLYFI